MWYCTIHHSVFLDHSRVVEVVPEVTDIINRVAMITRCSDTLFPSGIQSCTVHICIFPALTCLLAPLDLSDSLCCKNLKRNNDHFHHFQLHLQLPTLRSALPRIQVGTIAWLWVALNEQAEQHPWLSCSNIAGERQPLKVSCHTVCWALLCASSRWEGNKEPECR